MTGVTRTVPCWQQRDVRARCGSPRYEDDDFHALNRWRFWFGHDWNCQVRFTASRTGPLSGAAPAVT